MSETALTPELLAKLRHYLKTFWDDTTDAPISINQSQLLSLLDAADEVARLRAERDIFKAVAEGHQKVLEVIADIPSEQILAILEAENAKLRADIAAIRGTEPKGEQQS